MLLAETAKTPGPEIGVTASVPRKCPPDAGLDWLLLLLRQRDSEMATLSPILSIPPYTWLSLSFLY
jgi:hypothetical protein